MNMTKKKKIISQIITIYRRWDFAAETACSSPLISCDFPPPPPPLDYFRDKKEGRGISMILLYLVFPLKTGSGPNAKIV